MNALEAFLKGALKLGPATAYEAALDAQGRMRETYDTHGLGDILNVCLRLPTGGGKILLAAHAVKRIAQHYLSEDAPVVLWFANVLNHHRPMVILDEAHSL